MTSREDGRGLDWPLLAAVRPVVAALFRLRVDGEIPPPGGPLLIAANHVSHLDPLVLGVTVADSGRLPRFLVTAGVFEVPVVGAVMRRTSVIRVGAGAMDAAAAVLRAGATVVIYPEGHVARTGRPLQAKVGVAALSRRTGAPILPVAQWGMQRSERPLAWARQRRAAVVIGEPLPPPAVVDQQSASAILDAVRALLPRAQALAAPNHQSWG